ncbi:MAG TPA: ROK family transcriptional regulator [Anaerolineae bacterium]|nr:ROK family transcriptional regulator [Anaerolineae bacterium]
MTVYRTASSGMVKDINRALVFRILRERQRTSRADIVAATGLSKGTVSRLVHELIVAGLAHEAGSRSIAVGRPHTVLVFNSQAYYVLAAELHPRSCSVGLFDLNAQPLEMTTVPLPSTKAADVVDSLQRGFEQVGEGIAPKQILGCGVGVPGIVNLDGEITLSVVMDWRNVPLRQLLADVVGCPALVIGRVRAAAWAERVYGTNRRVDSMVYIRVGASVGSALILDGRLYMGADAAAGELGHVTIVPDGPLCPCGNRGCLSTLVSRKALVERTRDRLRSDAIGSSSMLRWMDPASLTLEDVIAAATAADPIAVDVIREAGRYLGIAVANTINFLNPRVVVVAGPLSAAGEQLLKPLRDEVSRRALEVVARDVDIVTSNLDEHSTMIGVADLILQPLSDPKWLLESGVRQPWSKR